MTNQRLAILPVHYLVLVLMLSTCYSQDMNLIADELVWTTVRDYTQFCPLTDVCTMNSSRSVNASVYGGSNYVPCCSDCLCEECGNNCCPDKPEKYLSDEEVYEIKHHSRKRCLFAQYKSNRLSTAVTSPALDMVVSCPRDYNNLTVITRCERPYQDFNLHEDLAYFPPVFDQHEVFKNKYCAICNGIDDKVLNKMNVVIRCTDPSYFPSFSNFEELINFIDEEADCNIAFMTIPMSVSGEAFSNQTCKPLIDRCNVTGNWREFDADMERACLSYMSVYNNMYRNIHCYLCNKGEADVVMEMCEAPDPGYGFNAFTALLDFNGLQSTPSRSDVRDQTCPQDHIYDAMQEKCMQLTCPNRMYVEDRVCRTLYVRVGYIGTNIYFTLEPSKDIQDLHVLTGSLSMLQEALWYHVTRYLEDNQSKFFTCQQNGFIVFKRDHMMVLNELAFKSENTIMYSDIDYIAIRISISGRYNASTFEKDMDIVDGLFTNYKRSPYLSHYIIRYRKMTENVFHLADLSLTEYLSLGNTIVDPVAQSLSMDPILHNAFGAAVYSDSYNMTICPLGPYDNKVCNADSDHQLQQFCPKLEIEVERFRKTDQGIQFTGIDASLSNKDLMFTMNDTALVCYKAYIALVDKLLADKNAEHWTPSEIVTVIALCLSLVSLLLTLTTYTLLKQLRTLPGLNIMGLTISLFISHLLSLINTVTRTSSDSVCVALGIALHVFLLLAIFWMFVCTFHMTRVFMSLRKVSSTESNKVRTFLRYCVFTIIMTGIFVSINMIITSVRTDGDNVGYNNIRCYIESLDMVLITSAVPIGIVVITDLGMFICVVIKVGRSPDMKKCRTNDRNNIIIFAKLSTITGITYIFGFIYQFTEIEFFVYIFVLSNASQGVFIFFAFILNQRVFGMFKQFYADRLGHKTSDKHALHITREKTDSESHHSKVTEQTSL